VGKITSNTLRTVKNVGSNVTRGVNKSIKGLTRKRKNRR